MLNGCCMAAGWLFDGFIQTAGCRTTVPGSGLQAGSIKNTQSRNLTECEWQRVFFHGFHFFISAFSYEVPLNETVKLVDSWTRCGSFLW